MQTVAETSIFTRKADALLTREEKAELIGLLASNPRVGVVIPGTGGVRKLRFAAGGQGKRGAFRVIYYVLTDALPVVAITIYGKNEQADLTPQQKAGALAIVAAMKAELTTRKAEEPRTHDEPHRA